jgi:hypothetical protein
MELFVFNIGQWEPKIGDPSFAGWFTVVSYYLCAALSLTQAWKAWPQMEATARRFRIAVTVVVLVLGISKHLNLPGAITEFGRLVTYQMGGYATRRWLQVVILLFVTLGVVLLVRSCVRRQAFLLIRKHGAAELICLAYLSCLAVLRAISLHEIGALLSADVFGVRVNWLVELGGIYALIVILLLRILREISRGTMRSRES